MSAEGEKAVGQASESSLAASGPSEQSGKHELHHVRSSWWCFMLMGVLLIVCGTSAIVFPVITSWAAITVLGAILLVAGVTTIITAFWAGKWSGMLVQLLVGILYVGGGLVVADHPVISTLVITVFVAMAFMVLGAFRAVSAMVVQYPQWGWALLNGTMTFLVGLIIYRQLPLDALWVIGLLVGLEMLLNGWTWLMLGLAIRRLAKSPQA
jgi:uncharacterized membrane protein HdeD (DUF308 family)